FYSINKDTPLFRPFKILNNIIILNPLIEKLKKVTKKIILYGSCAQGDDTAESDVDLFIISDQKNKVLRIITQYSPGKGFESIRIQPIIQSPKEAMSHEKEEKEFYSLIREGIVLWESPIDESRF
ncbi:nucleotidyltransferase domain-containing protein, partial [Candidatus Aminicenantes bacterium AC-334-K16]|nr:nucleotidyltransferase domain-containing protein [Candidatus Aminicenantes bacterium AC-334-K16]